MRKSAIRKLLLGSILLLAGCNEPPPKIDSSETTNAEPNNFESEKPTDSIEGNTEISHPDFDLIEIPIAQNHINVPRHIAEVNSDIQKISSESANPARKIWDKYFQIAITQKQANEIVPADVLWERLTQKLESDKLPTPFYNVKEGESINLKIGLYGLYLASFISSSEGGAELFDFIEMRAVDRAVKAIDLDLFKILISGMIDSEGRLDKMYFDRWGELSKSSNPVYKMLAIQIGDRLFEENGIAPENLIQRRLRYYEPYLKDDSRKLRIEALKGIRNLGDELALPVLDAYLKGEYGEADRIEVESIFRR